MAVPFEELEGSPTVALADGKLSATRRFKIAWSERFAFLRELYGGYRVVGATFTYTPPQPFPGAPQLIALSIEIQPFPPDRPDGAGVTTLSSATNAFEFALVTAVYAIPEHGNDSRKQRSDLPNVPLGTYLHYSSDIGAEYVVVPGRFWTWGDGLPVPVPEDVNPGILVPTEDFTLTWSRVPLPPWTAMRDLRGKINSATFLGHAVGTVMFLGVRTARDFQIEDTGLWRLEYHFKVNAKESTKTANLKLGWNFFWRKEDAAGEHWIDIEDDATGDAPYAAGDFSALFEFGT